MTKPNYAETKISGMILQHEKRQFLPQGHDEDHGHQDSARTLLAYAQVCLQAPQ